MRNLKVFISDVVRKPPMLMPIVALAHILWLAWVLWSVRYIPFAAIEWLQVLWMLGYTICWVAACDLRRWGAIGYMLLTLVNVGLHFFMKDEYVRDMYMSNLFLLDGMFSAYLLFYFKELFIKPKQDPLV